MQCAKASRTGLCYALPVTSAKAGTVALAFWLVACSRGDGPPTPSGATAASSAPPPTTGAPSGPLSAAPAHPVAALVDLPAEDAAIAPAQADTLVPADGRRIELLETGTAPRRDLAYPDALAQESVELTIELEMVVHQGTTASGVPVPSMVVGVVLGVEKSGKSELVATIADVAVHESPGPAGHRHAGPAGHPHAGSQMGGHVAPDLAALADELRGVGGRIDMTTRGPTGTTRAVGKVSTELFQLWSTVMEAVLDVVPRLPERPVGVGARWRVFDRLRRGGVETIRRTDFRLTALEPRLVLDGVVLERAVASSSVRDPAVPKDLIITASAGRASGARHLERDRAALAPWIAKSHLESTLALESRPNAKEATTVQRTRVSLEQRLGWTRRSK